MKIFNNFNIINPAAVLICTMLVLTFSVSTQTYAQGEYSGKYTGFEKGKHEGHHKENGKRKGHENERNPWNAFYNEDAGVDFELTVHNHAITPNVTFTETYNSLMTIQELLVEIVGDETDGFYIQECYEEFDLIQGTISDCEEGQSAAPLDGGLTLEEAGFVEDPEAHLVYIP
ncbi:MAG: hypothetical protein WD750_02335 [Gammaproteobacteria bacterium]